MSPGREPTDAPPAERDPPADPVRFALRDPDVTAQELFVLHLPGHELQKGLDGHHGEHPRGHKLSFEPLVVHPEVHGLPT